MKGFDISFQANLKYRVLNPPMQQKEMGMSFTYTDPNHRWPLPRVEDTDTAQWQKKWRNTHLAQSLSQPICRRRFHPAQKAESQMKLFLWNPAQSVQMRIEPKQQLLAARRKFDPDKEPFRRKHPQR